MLGVIGAAGAKAPFGLGVASGKKDKKKEKQGIDDVGDEENISDGEEEDVDAVTEDGSVDEDFGMKKKSQKQIVICSGS